jgi:hypothetical protein
MKPRSYRLSAAAEELVALLSARLGLDAAAVLEAAVHKLAANELPAQVYLDACDLRPSPRRRKGPLP